MIIYLLSVFIPKQLTTNPAGFIIVTNLSSSQDTGDTQTASEEIQLVKDCATDEGMVCIFK